MNDLKNHIRKAMTLLEAHDAEVGNNEDLDCAYDELRKALALSGSAPQATGSRGGKKSSANMTRTERSERAKAAAQARWGNQ